MKNEMSGRVEFVKVNGDSPESKPLMRQYEIKGYPTLVWLDGNGTVVDRSGYETADKFRERVQRLLTP